MIETLGKLERLPADFPWLNKSNGCVHFEFEHHQHYLDPVSSKALQVLLLNDEGDRQCLVTPSDILALTGASDLSAKGQFEQIAKAISQEPVYLDRPMRLEPVFIPKPWGQEIWYSGIEARGLSTIQSVPIAWLLDIFGEVLGCTNSPVLLKTLDPFPVENLGDLYFELHEKKVEVYIVTHVDGSAWPGGEGRIRYGFNQAVLNQHASSKDFLRAYLDCVQRYEAVRREIDDLLQPLKQQQGIEPGATLGPTMQQELLSALPEDLITRERNLREEMYQFTSLKTITTGDVITVAPFVPHSLQHGVRVVEFQTPHYERHILSFGQEVLTQDHWDTEAAINRAVLETEEPAPPRELAPGQDLVADFDEFRVIRLTLSPGDALEREHSGYLMLMGVSGEMNISRDVRSTLITAEAAWYLAPAAGVIRFENQSLEPAILLLAEEPASTQS